jgi:hypothetical protein
VLPERGKSGATPAILIGRIVLLVAAASAVVASVILSRARAPTDTTAVARYLCPMHPEVTSAVQGECPICRMALVAISDAPRTGAERADPHEWSAAPLSTDGSKFGSYEFVEAATRRVFSEEIRAPAWLREDGRVSALLYRHELTGLTPGEPAVLHAAESPSTVIPLHLAPDSPTTWSRSMSLVTFEMDRSPDAGAAAPVLRSGALGWVKLAPHPHALLVVPEAAVLESSEGEYVLTIGPGGHGVARQPVEIGGRIHAMAVVLSGLREGDRVFSKGAFFRDAELRLHAQTERVTPTAAP